VTTDCVDGHWLIFGLSVGAAAQIGLGVAEALIHTGRYVNYKLHKRRIKNARSDAEKAAAKQDLAVSLKEGWSVDSFLLGSELTTTLIPAIVTALAGVGIVTLGVCTGGAGALIFVLALVACPCIHWVTSKVVRIAFTAAFLSVENEQRRMIEQMQGLLPAADEGNALGDVTPEGDEE